MNEWLIGQQVRIKVSFTADNPAPPPAKIPADPTVTSIIYRHEDDLVVTTLVYGVDAGVIKDAVGEYHYDFIPDRDGVWLARGEGTGNVQAPDEITFRIRASSVLV